MKWNSLNKKKVSTQAYCGCIAQIWGAVSDRSRSRFGRRRVYVCTGQLLSTFALLMMPLPSYVWVVVGYTVYQLFSVSH